MLKKISKKILNKFGYDLIKKVNSLKISTNRAEGYPKYLEEAQKIGMDVNDYINLEIGAMNNLEEILFPYLEKISDPAICELGIGTGRYSREIAKELSKNENWKLYLVDHSKWVINFLNQYFENNPNIKPILNDGRTLPFQNNESIDVIFSNACFTELSLVKFYSYCREFYRVLKTKGYVIFNYMDINTPEAWNHLKDQSINDYSCFTYHSFDVIDKIFTEREFELINRFLPGGGTSVFVIYRKK